MGDTVIGVDPGGTTGIAVLRLEGLESFDSYELREDQVLLTLEMEFHDIQRRGSYPLIAVEKFITGMHTGRHTRQPAVTRLETNIQSFAVTTFGADFMYITPTASEAKRFTNEHLRYLGWWKSKMDHANDAARHVLFMLVQRHPDVIERLFRDYKI